jgi:Flp pilus assembly protein TadG
VALLPGRIRALARSLCSAKGYARCNRGASAVEFALIAAPFLALLVAILQTALVFFAGRVLDETTEQASRYILTGQAQTSGMTQSQWPTTFVRRVLPYSAATIS